MARLVQERERMAHRSSFAGGSPPLAVLIPALAGLVVLGLLIGVIGGNAAEPAASQKDPAATAVVAGEPAGSVWPIAAVAPSATPTPTSSPSPTPTATPEPTDEPTPSEEPTDEGTSPHGSSAHVAVCRSVSGSHCNGEFETLPRGARRFWFVVDFAQGRPGEVLATRLDGPTRVDTVDFTLRGGERHAWGPVSATNLKPGKYTFSVDRNGKPIAATTFTVD